MKKLFSSRLSVFVLSILTCLALSGCGLSSSGDAGQEADASSPEQGEIGPGAQQGTDSDAGREAGQADPSGAEQDPSGDQSGALQSQTAIDVQRGKRIEDQTFEVNLRPLGQVTFSAYEPDTSENNFADVVFLIEKDGQALMQLPGTTEDNVGLEVFNQVEAVSFTDYNNDGYDDIIIIVSYDLGAGPQAARPHSLIRYYKGTASDGFIFEKDMSENASGALTEITIETARSFISGKRADLPDEAEAAGGPGGNESGTELAPWQQAYLKYLSEESVPDAQSGYTLIRISDDGIPQIAEIGADMATGARIVHYAGGRVHVTQLNRLNFTYIPGGNMLCNSEGNMDYYYDLVFCLEEGEFNLIASGYYGAEDNSNIQFDDQGNPIYIYEWEGTPVSEQEYQKELSRVYDFSKAQGYEYEDLLSVEELKKAIEQYVQ